MVEVDTIAAVCTPPGQGGIGIVRVSGPKSRAIVDSIFRPKNRSKARPFLLRYGHIIDGANIIDEALVSVMSAPRTYTTQDMAEFNCHGGYAVLQHVLKLTLYYGARLAEPGEFTKLAFLNGRIDLTQAEAVMDIINAETEYGLSSAASQLSGCFRAKIVLLRDKILSLRAEIEVAIDYPDDYPDDYQDIHPAESYDSALSEIIAELDRYISSAAIGVPLARGLKTVILGKPNVGKSSLLNALLEQDRAIVSDIPGVTRDALTESFRLGHLLIKLTDTAGIRDTGEHIEQMGVERSYKAAKDADMILWVLDSSNELTSEDYHIYETVVHSADANTVGVLNKSDLRNMLDDQELASKFDLPFIRVSATDGSGINDLKIHIINTFTPDKIQASEDIITNVRHKDALERASNYLRRASDNALQGLPEDFISMELSEAYNSLGEILGEKANEDLINKIFDSFCVGK